jgi:hypothetical protein
MWSLAVEEQFYLALPLITVGLLSWRRRTGRWWLLGLGLVAIVGSTLAAAALHAPGAAPGRAYYGTDVRMAEPLVGVVLAVLLIAPSGRRILNRGGRAALDVMGIAGAVGLGLLIYRLTDRSDGLYRGGFLAAAVCTAAILAAATQPGTLVGRLLSPAPLVAVGRVSYGIYLFHWPVFLWLTPRSTGLHPIALLLARSALTLAAALVSYWLIERPVRWGRVAGRLAAVGWFDASVGLLAALVLITLPPVPHRAKASAAGPTTATTTPDQAADAVAAARRTGAGASKGAQSAPSQSISSAVKAAPPTPPGQGAQELMATDGAPDKPPTVKAGPTGKMPLKVLVVGDSMARSLAAGLKSWAQSQGDVVVYNLSTSGCPLSAGGGTRRFSDGSEFVLHDYCDWWTDSTCERSKYAAQFDADVVVMQDGMNELPDRETAAWDNYRHPGQPSFDNWLLNQYSQAVNTFKANGATVLFLNAACADWIELGGAFLYYQDNGDGDNRVAAINRTTTATATTGVQIADFDGHLCPNGQFTQTVDGVNDARPDGYHLSAPASDAVSERWLGPLIRQAAGQEGPVLGPG